jgi:hypothetical protein
VDDELLVVVVEVEGVCALELAELSGGVALGGVWAPAIALMAKVASATGSRYVFIYNLLGE